MPAVAGSSRARLLSQISSAALIAVAVAGCSSETSRFGGSSYSWHGRGSETTGSVASARSAPVGRVEAQPLPQTSAVPPPSRPAYVASGGGYSGGGRGIGSYTPGPGAEVTGSVVPPPPPAPMPQQQAYVPPPPPPQPPAPPRSHWSWDGGTAITVRSGDTLDRIAARHSVPASAILQANGILSPTAIRPGQRLVIPRYDQTPTGSVTAPRIAATAPHRPEPPPGPAARNAAGGVHIVAPGETLTRIARHYNKPIMEIARANRIEPHSTLKIGDRLVIPGLRVAAARPPAVQPQRAAPPPPPPVIAQPRTAPVMPPPQQKVVVAEPPHNARIATPVDPTPEPSKPATDASGAQGFRWPVRGRIIAGFGPKPTGQQNDGINIAVPEGTPVKSAEDGIVAYAGNELKGYGNLVLVRHSNGYVTAYAHASELLVKRGDQVKRGQIIARSGQTGSVTSPQLHFEVRKGSSPVDPVQFLDHQG